MFLKALVLLAAVIQSTDGVPIHYDVRGTGEPALVSSIAGLATATYAPLSSRR